MGGHHVLAIPVPALDDVVRERTAFYDDSFVSADPNFVHAHITLLAPWIKEPTVQNMQTVAEIAAAATPFEFTLTELGEFPDGLIYLRPEPDLPFRSLTRALTLAFPDHPPYGGRFGDVAPHLTLDRRSRSVTPDDVLPRVQHLLPLTLTATEVHLQWWNNHDCRRTASWRIGGP